MLFIDEVHRLGRAVEEILYPAMEDYALDIVIGKGPSARSIRLKLPRFSVIGATTRLALMTAPLRARFGAVYRFDFYTQDALESIVTRAAALVIGTRLHRAHAKFVRFCRRAGARSGEGNGGDGLVRNHGAIPI